MRDALGVDLWEGQKRIVRAIVRHRLVAVRTGHSIGKTHCVGSIVPWWLGTAARSTVITTSAAWTNVKEQIWPEIRKVAQGAPCQENLKRFDLAPKGCKWDWGTDWGAFGISTNKAENFGGFHAPGGLLTIVDEASHLEKDIYDAIMTGGGKVLMLGNPLRPEGPFYQAFGREKWHSLHISSLESPNVQAGREVIPGLATQEWVDERKAEWGEESPTYGARVLGQFPESAEDVVVQMDWADRARDLEVREGNGPLRMGVDVARFGSDRTVAIWRDDVAKRGEIRREKQDTMETAGMVKRAAENHGIDPENVAIDDTGLGGGVTDRLHELGFACQPENFGAGAEDKEQFANRRAELYWQVRDAMQNEPISLAGDEQLANELTWAHYGYTSKGQYKIEPKDDIKKRHGRSPDLADAWALTYAVTGGDLWIW